MTDLELPDSRIPLTRNGSMVGMVRFLIFFAAAVAAVVLFAWASQARQDNAIRRNETAIAVLGARLDAICERLEEIRSLLVKSSPERRLPGSHAAAATAAREGAVRRRDHK